jgi:hypothetical protein
LKEGFVEMNTAVCIAAFELLSSLSIRSFTRESGNLKLFVVSTTGRRNEVVIQVPEADCPRAKEVLSLCAHLLNKECTKEMLEKSDLYITLGRYLLQSVTASIEEEPEERGCYKILVKIGPTSTLALSRKYVGVDNLFEVFRSVGALLSGYTLTDHSVYLEVRTPAGAVREVLSGQVCSCGKRSCIHDTLGSTYYSNVQPFLTSGIAALHSN